MPRSDHIDRLVGEIAPDPGPGLTPLARRLMDEITATPVAEAAPRPRRRRRRWLAVPVAAGLAAAALAIGWLSPALPGLGPGPAAAALDIRRDGDHYVITVRDLHAAPQVYERELRARGIDVTLKVLPTSRAKAGSVYVIQDLDRLLAEGRVPAEGRITLDGPPVGEEASPGGPVSPLAPPGSCTAPGVCPIGVRIPVDLAERAQITIGREARPGEGYVIRPDAGAAGEPLHCVPYVNRTVAEVTRAARARGVEPAFAHAGAVRSADQVPGDWHVHEGVMSGEKSAIFLIGPEPDPSPRPDPAPGCPGS